MIEWDHTSIVLHLPFYTNLLYGYAPTRYYSLDFAEHTGRLFRNIFAIYQQMYLIRIENYIFWLKKHMTKFALALQQKSHNNDTMKLLLYVSTNL